MNSTGAVKSDMKPGCFCSAQKRAVGWKLRMQFTMTNWITTPTAPEFVSFMAMRLQSYGRFAESVI
jgi:hypothetical protein